MPEHTAKEQLEATRALTAESAALRRAIEESPQVIAIKEQAQKLKIVVAVMGAIVAFSLVASWFLYQAYSKSQDALDEVEASQVVACQNANETRGDQIVIWDFILDVSAGDDCPRARQILEDIRSYIHKVFRERDCTDLDKKYKTPVPPDVQELLDSLERGNR
jgi:hypothetical protein